MHPADPIDLMSGSLCHSTYSPGCLLHICCLYDNKNHCFVSFPTLDYLPTMDSFHVRGGKWGELSALGHRMLKEVGALVRRQSQLKKMSRTSCRQTASLKTITHETVVRWKPCNSKRESFIKTIVQSILKWDILHFYALAFWKFKIFTAPRHFRRHYLIINRFIKQHHQSWRGAGLIMMTWSTHCLRLKQRLIYTKKHGKNTCVLCLSKQCLLYSPNKSQE